jgi:hypothetical protein
MKKVLLGLIFICLLSLTSLGHSGRTDRNGGHYNRKTGKYHHHGGSGFGWVFLIIGGVVVYGLIKSRNK